MTERDAYINLLAAVISQALQDVKLSERNMQNIRNKKSAEAFLMGKGLEAYCSLGGLNAEYIRKKAGLLTKAVSNSA